MLYFITTSTPLNHTPVLAAQHMPRKQLVTRSVSVTPGKGDFKGDSVLIVLGNRMPPSHGRHGSGRDGMVASRMLPVRVQLHSGNTG